MSFPVSQAGVMIPATAGPRAGDRHLRAAFTMHGASLGLLLPFLVLVLQDRGFTPSRIGILMGVYALSGAVSAPLWSSIADRRWGGPATLRVVLVSEAAAMMLMAATGSDLLATGVAVAAAGSLVTSSGGLLDAVSLTVLGEEGHHRYGTFRLFGSLGWAVVAVAFGAVLERGGLHLALPACAAALLVFSATTAWFRRPRNPPPPMDNPSRWGSTGDALAANPRLVRFLMGLLLVSMATAAAWNVVPLRISGQGGGALLAGLGFGAAAFFEVPIMLRAPLIIQRLGLRGCYVTGSAVYAAQMLLMAVVSDPVIMTVVLMGRGVAFGFVCIAIVPIANGLVPDGLRNTGQLLACMAASGLGPAVGSVLGGAAYASWGAAFMFPLCAGLTVLGSAVIWRSLGTTTAATSTRFNVPWTPWVVSPD